MGLLLEPADTILLAVASPGLGSNATRVPGAARIGHFIQAAAATAVPVLEAHYPETGIASVRTPVFTQATTYLPNLLEVEPRDWSATTLGRDVANLNRTSLIVVGYWLEEAVTFLVLRSLAHSYRVYIVLDALTAENAGTEDAARQRLVFAGAIPTTTHQIVREWAATTPDPNCRRALRTLRAV